MGFAFLDFFRRKKTVFINTENKDSTIIQTVVENLYLNSKEEFSNYLLPKIKKSNLLQDSKLKFVNIDKVDNLIKRYYFDNENNKDEINYTWDKREIINLIEIIDKNNKVILLGNPGLGKSTELQQYANYLWNEKNSEYIPIYRNLKDFTHEETIDNYTIKDWNRYEKLIFVLDGIDEIANIENFKSKLENFIRNIEIENIDFKFILSCRTNIYESIVKSVSDFKPYYLKDLSYEEGIQLLTNQCGDIVNSFTLNYNDLVTNFLKNPFQIKILANYINANKKLPTNVAELWSNYIEQRLTNDEKYKSSKTNLNIYRLKENSKRVSLVNELMKVNVISGENIFKIVNKDYLASDEFIRNPLTEKLVNSDNYTFEHRNLQEYFAAFYISEFDIERIKQIILIENTKSHPTLFNVISLLLDILDKNSDKFKSLINWFIENEPEILFKSDSNRLDKEIRIDVFRKYFQKQCIEKTHWINSNNVYTTRDISRFGNFPENIDYLLGIINNKENNIRAILSAYELLSGFDIPYNKVDDLKEFLISTLINSETTSNIKSQIIRCIDDLKFAKDDINYFNQVYDFILNEDGNEINSAFLGLIRNYTNIDEIFEYIKLEFKRVHNIITRNDGDDVLRGNNWVLNDLIFKLKNSNNFIELISFSFINNTNLDFYTDDYEKILERCKFFTINENDFVVRLLTSFNGQSDYYSNEILLIKIITETNSVYSAIEYLIENNEFSKVNFFIHSFIDENALEIILNNYNLEKIDSLEIESFRSSIWNYDNTKLAEKFTEIMTKSGFVFESNFLSSEQFYEKSQVSNAITTQNFQILFRPNELLKEIKNIFDENGLIEINRDISLEIRKKMLKGKEYRYQSKIESSVQLLNNLTRKYEKLDFIKICEIVNDTFEVFNVIKFKLESNKNSNYKFEITEAQIIDIENWCDINSQKIDFETLQELINLNGFSDTKNEDYTKLKLIFYFLKEFNLNLDKGFLLNCIEFFDMENSIKNKNFNYIFDKINDPTQFDNKIIENLKRSHQLFSFSLSKHIIYALDNKLSKSYDDIRKSFLFEGYEYNLEPEIEKYFILTKDISLLIDLCTDINSYKCWSAINILMKNKIEDVHCFNIAINYLDLKLEPHNPHYSRALEVLFKLNKIEAIQYYLKFLKLEKMISLNQNCFKDYNVIDDYSIIKQFLILIYNGSDENQFRTSDFSSLINSYISNLSFELNSYEKIQNTLNELLVDYKLKNFDSGIFYVNLLIDNSKNSYVNSKSKALTFDEALTKVEEILK